MATRVLVTMTTTIAQTRINFGTLSLSLSLSLSIYLSHSVSLVHHGSISSIFLALIFLKRHISCFVSILSHFFLKQFRSLLLLLQSLLMHFSFLFHISSSRMLFTALIFYRWMNIWSPYTVHISCPFTKRKYPPVLQLCIVMIWKWSWC